MLETLPGKSGGCVRVGGSFVETPAGQARVLLGLKGMVFSLWGVAWGQQG